MEIIVSIFGKNHKYNLTPREMVENVAETLYDYADIEYMDNENHTSLGDYLRSVLLWCTRDKITLTMDGTQFDIPTPIEVKRMSPEMMRSIAIDILIRNGVNIV